MEKRQIPKDAQLSLSDLAYFFETEATLIEARLKKLDVKWKSKSTATLAPKATVEPKLVRALLEKSGYKIPRQIISFQMLKGGVSKTTSAFNFGWRAAQYGARVLFVDLDQQANLSFALGVDAENLPVWVDIVEKKTPIAKAIVPVTENIDLIPSSLNNSVLDRVLYTSHRNLATAVKAPLKEIQQDYDLIILDTAPSLSAINTAVTCASDVVILPINPDKFSMIGVRKHLDDLNEMRSDFDLEFETKVLFTRFDGRESASQAFLEECLELFENSLLKHYIRSSAEIKNALSGPRTIFATKNNAKEDYDGLTRELLGIWNEKQK